MDDLFDRLDALAEADDCEGLERAALRALRDAEGDDAVDLWRYVAWARFELGRLREALDAARRAHDPLFEAKACFHLWDFAGARDALGRFEGGGDDAAEAEWYRGLVAEFTGDAPEPHFALASRLAPDLFDEPVRLSDAEVDAVVQEAIHALPEPVARALEDALIEIVPLPRPHPDVDPLTLGLYAGVDRLSRSVDQAVLMPARIEVYRANVERIARDHEEAVEELRITLLHEVGHHLGYDEEGLDRLDLG